MTAGRDFAMTIIIRAGVVGTLWLLAYAAATAYCQDRPDARQFLGDIVYLLPVAVAAGLSLVVALRATGRRRRFWWLLVASNGLWLLGDLIWATYAYVLHREAPFPSVADGSYLLSYALVPAAVLVGFGGASARRRARALLDAALVGLGVGAVGWQTLIAPQVEGSLSLPVLTGIAYPLLGIVIVITLAAVALSGHRKVPLSVWLVGAAFAVSALTDAGYTYLASLHEYVSGDWLNLGWQTEAVLLCIAGVVAARRDEGDAQVDALGRDIAMVPVLLGVGSAVALTGIDGLESGMSVLPMLVAALVIVGLVVRLMLSVSDTRTTAKLLDTALKEQERLAVTDGLTGLYNRRFFEEVLRMEADRAVRDGSTLALVVADLDHFKLVNDTHGHQSGDAVLVEAAARLQRTLRGSDILARYGGEEFVIILPGSDGDAALEIVERCRRALCEETIRLHSGQRITLTGSFGLACLPGDGREAEELVRRADRALYAAKDHGRNRVVTAAALDVAPEHEPAIAPEQLADTWAAVRAELLAARGTSLDPGVVDAFLQLEAAHLPG